MSAAPNIQNGTQQPVVDVGMTTPQLATEDQTQANSLPQLATELVISDQAGYERAGSLLTSIKAIRKKIADTFDPHIKAAHDAHKRLIATKNEFDDPNAAAEKAVKGKLKGYIDEEERKARIAQIEADRKAKEADEAQRLAEAEALEEAGESEAANEVLEAPPAPPPPPKAAAPKAAGVSVRKVWSAGVVDGPAFLQAVVDGNANAKAVLNDEKVKKAINARLTSLAKSLQGELEIPGVQVYCDTNIAGTGR